MARVAVAQLLLAIVASAIRLSIYELQQVATEVRLDYRHGDESNPKSSRGHNVLDGKDHHHSVAAPYKTRILTRTRVLHTAQGLFRLVPTLCLSTCLTPGPALLLCECEKATGPPFGLGCSKEGWFISNFENQGTWVSRHMADTCMRRGGTCMGRWVCTLREH